MRKIISVACLAAVLAVFVSGCAGPEQKLGRGLGNTMEFARLNEMRRSIEQTEIFEGSGAAFTTGVIHGFDQTVARVGLGVAEVATFPIPPYDPIATRYLPAFSTGPESYKPGMYSDAMFDTDTDSGFSGGDVAPFVPGSRFKIFDN